MRLLAVVLGALLLAGPAYAGASFQDTVGENPAAADISTISVANDPAASTVTFKVQITNMPDITEDNAAVELYLDGDNNGTTGKNGIDCVVGIDKDGWYFLKWDGTQFSQVTGLGLDVTYDKGLWTSTMHVSDCSLQPTFGFWLSSYRGADPNNPVTDEAPDGDTLYSYTLTTASAAAPTVKGTAVTVSGPPKAGTPFTVVAFSVVLSDGSSLDLSGTTCTATLGGAKLRGTGHGGCRFAIPKNAHGKKLVVHVSGKAAGVTVRKTVTYRVR